MFAVPTGPPAAATTRHCLPADIWGSINLRKVGSTASNSGTDKLWKS